MKADVDVLTKLILKQLNNFFDIDPWVRPLNSPAAGEDGVWGEGMKKYVTLANNRFLQSAQELNACFNVEDINPYHTVQWSVFLYYLAHEVGINSSYKIAADQIYYLNKIMNCVEWYWGIELPHFWWAEHPIGSVLGRAEYGDYFFFYQGCTVGGNRKNETICYPHIGHHVLMYANSSILGESMIGNYVILSADTLIMDENIPDGSIVFGKSPNLKIVQKGKEDIAKRMNHIWRQHT